MWCAYGSLEASEKILTLRERELQGSIMKSTPLPQELAHIIVGYVAPISHERKQELLLLIGYNKSRKNAGFQRIDEQKFNDVSLHELEEIIDEEEHKSGLYLLAGRYMESPNCDNNGIIREKILEKIKATITAFPDSVNTVRKLDQQPLCQFVLECCKFTDGGLINHDILDILVESKRVDWFKRGRGGWTSLMRLVNYIELRFNPDPVKRAKDETLFKIVIGPPEKEVINLRCFTTGETALHVALRCGACDEIVRFLVEHKADPRIKDASKKLNALQLVIKQKRSSELIKFLSETIKKYNAS